MKFLYPFKVVKFTGPKPRPKAKTRLISVRLDETIVSELARLSKETGYARQKVVGAILRKALNDKTFTLDVSDF